MQSCISQSLTNHKMSSFWKQEENSYFSPLKWAGCLTWRLHCFVDSDLVRRDMCCVSLHLLGHIHVKHNLIRCSSIVLIRNLGKTLERERRWNNAYFCQENKGFLSCVDYCLSSANSPAATPRTHLSRIIPEWPLRWSEVSQVSADGGVFVTGCLSAVLRSSSAGVLADPRRAGRPLLAWTFSPRRRQVGDWGEHKITCGQMSVNGGARVSITTSWEETNNSGGAGSGISVSAFLLRFLVIYLFIRIIFFYGELWKLLSVELWAKLLLFPLISTHRKCCGKVICYCSNATAIIF